MSDNAGYGLLPDVRGMSLADLADSPGNGLDAALERILAASGECSFNSFNSAL